jgi:hypothetical protein
MEAIYGGIALTGPTQSEHTGPIAFPLDTLLQIAPIFRAQVKTVIPRGNDSFAISFSCIRRYASLLAAMDARAMFIKSLDRSGQLELVQFAGGSTLTIVGDAFRAATPEPVLKGVAVQFTFAFVVPSLNSSIVAGEGAYLRNDNGSILRNDDGEPLLAD